jgi:CspA family cold shock protein
LATGTVKFFNHSRGYGFIEPEDGSKDVFVHVTAMEQAGIPSLGEGDKVEYEVKQDERSGKSSAGDLKKL